MRKAGILFPISSLPSRFGIGCFSKEAYDFVDFLEKAGQSVWQILPLGPTGFGDSPYQSTSAFAGNPYFSDPVTLIEEGLLTWDETNAFSFGGDPGKAVRASGYTPQCLRNAHQCGYGFRQGGRHAPFTEHMVTVHDQS